MIVCIIMIAWILGILWGLYLQISIVFFLFSLILTYGIIIPRLNKKIKNHFIRNLVSKKSLILLLICSSLSYLQITSLETSFEKKYQGVEGQIQVIGTIVSNPKEKPYKTQYIIKVESINKNRQYQSTYLLLQVKKEEKERILQYGNKISFIAEFQKPTEQRNTGGFDYREYLKTKKIYGIVTAQDNKIKKVKENNVNRISKLSNTLANQVKYQANRLLPKQYEILLTGILIGDKEGLSEEIEEDFRKSNLTHMLAVSGSHVEYVLLGMGVLIHKMNCNKRYSKLIMLAVIFFFMLLTGSSASVMRACIMAMYVLMGSFFYKKVSVVVSLSLTMLILLVENPYCLFDIGLQLSYGGTIGIIYLYPSLQKWVLKTRKETTKKIWITLQEMFLVTLSANIIIVPIMLFHFNTLSLTFWISNILAGPFMGLLVLLGVVTIVFSFIFFPIAKILSIILEFFLHIFMQIAHICGNLPFSNLLLPTPKLYQLIAYYLGIVCLWNKQRIKQLVQLKRKKEKMSHEGDKKRNQNKKEILILFLLFVILVSFFISYLRNKEFKIYFIDVGQGDSMLIITPNQKKILIDGGGSKEKESFDVGEKTLLPYLLDRGVTKIDYMMISHFDSDHVRTDY